MTTHHISLRTSAILVGAMLTACSSPGGGASDDATGAGGSRSSGGTSTVDSSKSDKRGGSTGQGGSSQAGSTSKAAGGSADTASGGSLSPGRGGSSAGKGGRGGTVSGAGQTNAGGSSDPAVGAGGSGGRASVGSGGQDGGATRSDGGAGMAVARGGGDGAGGSTGPAAGKGGGVATDAGGSPTGCPATATLKAGDASKTVSVGGTSRKYTVHVPASYTGRTAVPLVLDFHGLMGSAANEKSTSGYLALSDKEGFIIVYPEGIDQAWNVGPCCTKSRTVDDLGFAKAVVTAMEADACIDAKRVYATGVSMGGGMSHYLACNAADIFAAVAPSAFDLLTADEEPCKPSRPIGVLSQRGTADTLVPYAGGASSPPNGLNVTIHFLGAKATLAKWGELDGCSGSATAGANNCEMYTQCQGGVQVGLCSIQGGSHGPGDANTGWAFLKSQVLP